MTGCIMPWLPCTPVGEARCCAYRRPSSASDGRCIRHPSAGCGGGHRSRHILEAFEVGDEVYEAFRMAGFPMEKIARRYPATGDGSGRMEKWHLDLWQANRGLLEGCGVPSARIHLAGVCTYLHSERFSSRTPLGHPFGAHPERYFSDGLIKNMDIW